MQAELVKGDNGVFDVFADEQLVFSKDTEGRFPDPPEVVAALRAVP